MDDARSIREARDGYYRENGMPPDGGYGARWVRLRVGPFPIAFPNTEARRRALPYHDIHHVVTGYSTQLIGEAEVGAWELASGCRHYPAAWILDLFSLYAGLFIGPRAAWRAFHRGRHTHNLYGTDLDDALLARPVCELRRELALDRDPPLPRLSDRVAFARTAATALLISVGPFLALVTAIALMVT